MPLRVLILASLLACTLAPPVLAAEGPAPLRHVRVTWMGSPSTQAVVSWTTTEAGASHAVRFDTQRTGADPGGYARTAASIRDGAYSASKGDAPRLPFYHHVLLDGLEPATTYHFVAVSDRHVSPAFHFTTAPADDRDISLIFGADSRRGPPLPEPHLDRRRINRLISTLVQRNPGILALVHGGDYCTTTEWRFMSDWLDDHELTRTADGRILPIIPARGNHDGSIGFEEIFFWPGRTTPYYYAVDASPQAGVLILNTETSVRGDQQDWLARELEARRGRGQRWIIAAYHRPAWGTVKVDGVADTIRQAWVPSFEKHSIDLVCEADHHALKRTMPIRDGKQAEDGIIYIGDGGLGVPQRKPDTSRWYLKAPGMTGRAHHVHVLDFGKDALHVRALGLDEEVLDDFTLQPHGVLVEAAP